MMRCMKKKAITDEEGDVLLTGFERFFFFNSSIDDMDPDGAKIKKKKIKDKCTHRALAEQDGWF